MEIITKSLATHLTEGQTNIINITQVNEHSTESPINENMNTFLSENEARNSLLRLNEHKINIREVSSYYSTLTTKPKKGKKFNFKVTVILLKNQSINKVPVPGRVE